MTGAGDALRVCLVGLIAGGHSGVPRYAAALTGALDEVASEFPALRLELLTTQEGAVSAGVRNIAVRDVRAHGRRANAGPGRIALEQFGAAASRADLLHFFDTNGPVLAPWRPFFATIHDAAVQQGLRPWYHHYKRVLWPWVARRAATVVAISDFARDEAITVLGVDPERVRVIVSGPGFAPPMNLALPRATAGSPFLLHVGTLAVSKNLPFLIESFDAAQLAADVRLVLVGRPGDGYADTVAMIERSQKRRRIEIRHDVGDGELEALYRSAVALVHPSRYEGFGFTPLEAMARGCPVVASDIPALRETAADGALLVPLDRAAWTRALEQIASDESLRALLSERGSHRIRHFSWRETARTLCRAFLEHRQRQR